MLATKVPLAATAGTPIPGQIESPVQTNPGNGVFGPANLSRPEVSQSCNEGFEQMIIFARSKRLRGCRVPLFTKGRLPQFQLPTIMA